MPIRGDDDAKGMLSDRDIVVKVPVEGKDPGSTRAGELGQGDFQTVTIGADDSIDEALRTTTAHKVRRLAVSDGHECVGISATPTSPRTSTSASGDLVEGSRPRRRRTRRNGAGASGAPAGDAPDRPARAGADGRIGVARAEHRRGAMSDTFSRLERESAGLTVALGARRAAMTLLAAVVGGHRDLEQSDRGKGR